MDLVQQLTNALGEYPEVVAAWLFGSHARGTAHSSSDADVAVLLAGDPGNDLTAYRFDLAAALGQRAHVAVDLVVVNRASSDLVHRVLRDGVLLIERDRSQRIAFETKKRAEYLDMAPVRHSYRRPRP